MTFFRCHCQLEFAVFPTKNTEFIASKPTKFLSWDAVEPNSLWYPAQEEVFLRRSPQEGSGDICPFVLEKDSTASMGLLDLH